MATILQQSKHEHVRVGGFLPYLDLPSAPTGAPVSLRPRGREATVVLVIHSADCAECRRYLSSVAEIADDLAAWDGRVVVIVPGSPRSAELLHAALNLPFTVAADESGEANLLEGAGAVIADRYGQVFYTAELGTEHTFTAPRELEEWLKYLATQCPE